MAAHSGKFHWLQAVFIALLLTGLALAVLYLLRATAGIDFATLAAFPWLPLAVALQILASSLFILAWQRWLAVYDRFSFHECAAHIGVTLLGKYIPGKIWGLVGRTVLLQRRGVTIQSAVDLLLADQFVTFYSGILLGVLALLAYFNIGFALLGALGAVPCVLFTFRNYQAILSWAWHRFGTLARRLGRDFHPEQSSMDKSRLYEVSAIYLLHWLLTAGVVALLFTPLIGSGLIRFYLLVIGAIPLAMLTGFVALWAPGGVGVREAVIIALLSLQTDLELAAAIAVCYRLICVLIDLTMGAVAFRYFSGAGAELLRGRDQVP